MLGDGTSGRRPARGLMMGDVMAKIVMGSGRGVVARTSPSRARARDAERLPAANASAAAWLRAYGARASDGRAPDVKSRRPGLFSLGRTKCSACLGRRRRGRRLTRGPFILPMSCGRWWLLAREPPSRWDDSNRIHILGCRLRSVGALSPLSPSVKFEITRSRGTAAALMRWRLKPWCRAWFSSVASLRLIDVREAA